MKFSRHFLRFSNQGWLCISSCEFRTPWGLLQVWEGTAFMPRTAFLGHDIAEWIENAMERERFDDAEGNSGGSRMN